MQIKENILIILVFSFFFLFGLANPAHAALCDCNDTCTCHAWECTAGACQTSCCETSYKVCTAGCSNNCGECPSGCDLQCSGQYCGEDDCGVTCLGTSTNDSCTGNCANTCLGQQCGVHRCSGGACYGTKICCAARYAVCSPTVSCCSTSDSCQSFPYGSFCMPKPVCPSTCSSLSECSFDPVTGASSGCNDPTQATCIMTQICEADNSGRQCECVSSTIPPSWPCTDYSLCVDGYKQMQCCNPINPDDCRYKIVQCGGTTPTPPPTVSCTITLTPATASVFLGETTVFTATVTVTGGTLDYVGFTSSNTLVATTTGTDSTSPYTTTTSGISPGSTYIAANGIMAGIPVCTTSSSVTVLEKDPWWQVIDADVTAGGDLSSDIPTTCTGACRAFFSLPGTGGFPGVPLSISSSYGVGAASSLGWDVNTTAILSKVFNYDYFFNKLPDDALPGMVEVPSGYGTSSNPIVPGMLADSLLGMLGGSKYEGYWLIHSNHTLRLSGGTFNLAGNKYIIFVEGNVDIRNPIQLTDGSGFFMIVATGNIIFNSTITAASPNIEGIYLANGSINVSSSANQFNGRGSFVGLTGITLARDLADNSAIPAETFTYAPDQIALMPSWFHYRRIKWKEVAP